MKLSFGKNWKRYMFFLVGIFLFVAPFALVARFAYWAMGSASKPSIHSTCLRMTVEWIFSGRLLWAIIGNPLYVAVIVLPIFAFFFGPLWCGWLCPAGSIPESLSRLTPRKAKIDLSGKMNPAAIRYGYLAGFALFAILGLGFTVCCYWCNFAVMEKIVEDIFLLNFSDLAIWAYSTGIITLVVWLVLLGVLLKGGRGWCNFACPIGAIQSLAHALGSRLSCTFKIVYDKSKCNDCGICIKSCPTWAITRSKNSVTIDRHLCIVCKECVAACHLGGLRYSRK